MTVIEILFALSLIICFLIIMIGLRLKYAEEVSLIDFALLILAMCGFMIVTYNFMFNL